MIPLYRGVSQGLKLRNFSLSLLLVGLLAAMVGDVQIYASEPWQHLQQMLLGLSRPSVEQPITLVYDLLYTLAFALLGVSLSVLVGFALSLVYQHWLVRGLCAFFRAIHELFWALIFIQLFGLSATSAILAIAIPYACTFARVFYDIYQQAPLKIGHLQRATKANFSYFLYVLIPQVKGQMSAYLRYRFECGVRTSAVLGFVGLPTIGFHLETAFKQGDYSYAGALLLAFYLLIASMKYWLKLWLLPLYLLSAIYFLPSSDFVNDNAYIWRFFSQDIWPRVVQSTDLNMLEAVLLYADWLLTLTLQQGLSGMVNTLLLSIMAVAASGLLAVLISPVCAVYKGHWLAEKLLGSLLLVMRSTPEYILAFILLLVLGPSMLPAVVALAIHNAGLISYLLQRNIPTTDSTAGLTFSVYLYRILPKSYLQFISLLMYRAEIILRESAILGVLGITTLGFYIDSAFEDLRFDRALALLLITALLNVAVDQFSRKMQLLFDSSHVRVRSKE